MTPVVKVGIGRGATRSSKKKSSSISSTEGAVGAVKDIQITSTHDVLKDLGLSSDSDEERQLQLVPIPGKAASAATDSDEVAVDDLMDQDN